MTFSFKQIVAAFFLIGGTFLMLSLGTWQIQRLEWKTGVIEALDKEYELSDSAPAMSLEEINTSNKDILYASVKGTLIPNRELFFGPKPHDGAIGYHVLSALQTKEGTILINRGWIDEHNRDILTPYPSGEIVVTGIIREPDWNSFTPDNNPTANVWTKFDVTQIATALKLKNTSTKILYLDKELVENDPVIAVHQKWYPRNKHKQYATFWFSMAFIFIGFFVFYARSEKKKLSD